MVQSSSVFKPVHIPPLIVEFVLVLVVLFCWCSVFCGLFPLLPAPFCSFFFISFALRLLFPDQNPSPFFLTHCTRKNCSATICKGPQGTVKAFMCEYLTNQQITCWQGEMQKGYSNLAKGDFWLHICNFTGIFSTFKDISAPLIFDQLVHNVVCICMWACGLSLV